MLEDTYTAIKEAGARPRNGIIHSFSGSLEMAERFTKLGMMISSSGVIIFKKTLDIQEVTQRLSLDRILIEANTPHLVPVPKRGCENRIAYTCYIVGKTTEPHGLTSEEVARATSDNVKRLPNCD